MSRYITTKADFTLRRKHKKKGETTIYENDYTTINPLPNALKGEYVIGDSNFVFTSRLGINAQKKHVRGKFVPNPSGSTDERGAWTMDTIIDSGITEETRIRLKPDYSSLRDFACYGSAVKLIQGTVNGVITDFPAEMYLSDETANIYKAENGAGYSFDSENEFALSGNILYNEYDIDITTINVQPESVYNPLRYFTLCGSSYTYIDKSGSEHELSGFSITPTGSGTCFDGKEIWIDQLAEVKLTFNGGIEVIVKIFKNYDDNSMFYLYTGGGAGCHIRPKKKIVEDYFRDCDDFTAVLLNRDIKPLYTANFETPIQTDTGIKYEMKSYTWPSLCGGFNPDLNGPYSSYLSSLIAAAEFYDEVFTDNMWRSLTHEAIKTLDWTYVSNTDGDTEDMSKIDTSRIEPITKIYGRQFDDLKRYADGIKSINTITYNQKSNTPDYTLTDALENSGWETKTLKITTDNDLRTDVLYSGMTSGYTASNANNEYLRRLKLNSKYLFSLKGTRRGLDTMLAMFGFKPEEYDIHEYVCVFSGTSFPHFCNETQGKDFSYPLAKDVSTINKYKVNFNSMDPYGDYCGIPVTEVGYFVENPSDPKNPYDYSYVVPWFSYGKKYDDGLYFQKHGGWGKRRNMDIDLEIAPAITSITDLSGATPLYMETQARLKFAKDFDELLQQAFASSNKHDVFYMTDIAKITDVYTPGFPNEVENASHYFVLENSDMNQFLGYSFETEKYGWRSIPMDEILNPSASTAGTLVLYLESIQDNTTGNNPHIGGGTYDDGMDYVSGMSEIFAYSILNKNFIGIDDGTCSEIAKFKFDVDMQEDNRKCWFFSDDYNKKYGKEAAYAKPEECGVAPRTITFKEVDVTDRICNIRNCNDSKIAKSGCNASLSYEIASLLNSSSAHINNLPVIGESADPIYRRKTKLDPFDPERNAGKNGEAAANSIVNIKNIVVCFNLPEQAREEEKTAFKRYIENSVMPYLTQMIPSTSILAWEFKNERVQPTPPPAPEPPKPVEPTMTYELVLSDDNGPITGPITIDSMGTTSLTATYNVYENGILVSSTDVTRLATWSSTDTSLVKVENGDITGHNEDVEAMHSAIVKVMYRQGYAEPKSVEIWVRGAEMPTIDELTADTPVDALATRIYYTATTTPSNVPITVKYLGQTNTQKQGTFIIRPNQSTSPVEHTITAYCTDYPTVSATTVVIQNGKQEFYFVTDDNDGEFYFVTDDNDGEFYFVTDDNDGVFNFVIDDEENGQ